MAGFTGSGKESITVQYIKSMEAKRQNELNNVRIVQKISTVGPFTKFIRLFFRGKK